MDKVTQKVNIDLSVNSADAQKAIKDFNKVLSNLTDAFDAIDKKKKVIEDLSSKLSNLAPKMSSVGSAVEAAGGSLDSLTPKAKKVTEQYGKLADRLKDFEARIGGSNKSAAESTDVLGNLHKSVSELIAQTPAFVGGFSDGIAAVSDKLPSLIDAYKQIKAQNAELQAQGQPTKSVFSQLAGAMFSWNSIISVGMVLISNYGEDLVKWARSLFVGKEAVDKSKESIEALNKSLTSTEYQKASENVAQLTTDIKLARAGYIDKNKVLEEYNRLVGESTGKATSLGQAETNLTKNAPAYIKLTLEKAAANAALHDAMQKSAEAEQEKLKNPKDDIGLKDFFRVWAGINDDAKTASQKWKATINSTIRLFSPAALSGAITDFMGSQKKVLAEVEKRRKKKIDELSKQSANSMAAFNQHRVQAAILAEKLGIDITTDGGGKPENTQNKPHENKKEKQKQAAAQAEAILKTSQAQQLLITTDGYAQQMIAAEEHFKEESEKLKSWYDNNLITRDKYDKAILQLRNERQAATKNAIDTFNKEDREKTLAASNELIELQIAAMAEGAEKQVAEINHQTELKKQALDKQKEELSDAISKSDASIKVLLDNGDGAAAAVERTHLISLRAQLEALEEKRKLLVAAGGKAVDDVRKAQEDQKRAAKNKATADLDEAAINETNKPGHAAEHFKALMTQLEHRKQAELENTKLTVEEKKKIEAKYDMDKAALEKTEHDRKLNEAIQTEEKIRSAAMNLLGGALKQASEARLRQLGQDKALELSNTSLTKSQKKAIEDKYKKLELQEKQRAFKQEQKMQIANAVMAGAVAVVKDLGSPWKIAFDIAMTAAQVATILKQKAPAYATGGLHYASDGRGALLSGPGSGTSDSMNARLSNGEAVINARSTGMYGDLLSAINVAGGGRPFGSYWGSAFAGGGTMGNTYLPTRNNPARMNLPLLASPTIDYDRLASSMTKVSLVLDVKDVNREQANLARAVNGSSH